MISSSLSLSLSELSGLAAPPVCLSVCVGVAALSGSAGSDDPEQIQHGTELPAHDEALHHLHLLHQAVCVCTAAQQVYTHTHTHSLSRYPHQAVCVISQTANEFSSLMCVFCLKLCVCVCVGV